MAECIGFWTQKKYTPRGGTQQSLGRDSGAFRQPHHQKGKTEQITVPGKKRQTAPHSCKFTIALYRLKFQLVKVCLRPFFGFPESRPSQNSPAHKLGFTSLPGSEPSLPFLGFSPFQSSTNRVRRRLATICGEPGDEFGSREV